MSPIDDAALDDLEIQVERYESARVGQGSVEIESFLPERDHPQYTEIAAELIRVDLEYGWREGAPRLLDWYRERFPEVFDDRELVTGIAFEEYRLRCQSGESVLAEEYRGAYGVDVSRWPSGREVERPWSERSTFRRSRRIEGRGTRGDSVSIRISEGPRRGTSSELRTLPPGSRCFGFEIESELGRGSSAIVYLAKQESLANRHVVLKMSNVPTAEPERLARLQHANIVPLFSYHQQDGLNVMCLPFLGRHTLLDWISHLRSLEKPPASTDDFVTTFTPSCGRGTAVAPGAGTVETVSSNGVAGTTDPARSPETNDLAPVWQELREAPYEQTVLRIVTDLARGLAYAHGQQILHLDLKPGNILLTDDGRPMLLDFHLSAKLRGDSVLEEVGGGTLPYMSPEQLQALYGRATVDAGSDLFSLGVVLFELLTGKLPYPNRRSVPPQGISPGPERRRTDDVLQAMEKDRDRIPSIRKLNPLVSPGTAAIIRKCLHPDSRQRYQSASQLVEDLERQQQDRPLKFAPNPSLFERFRKWRRRHPRLTLAFPVTAVVLVGTLALLSVATWNLKRLPKLEAQQWYQHLTQSGPEVKALLYLATVPERPTGIADPIETVEKGRQLIAPYGVEATDHWMKRPLFRFLPPEKRETAKKEIAQLLFLLAEVVESSVRDESAHRVGSNAAPGANHQEQLEEALLWNRRAYECLKDQPTAGLVLRQQASLLRRLNRHGEADAIQQELAGRRSSEDAARLLLETSLDASYRDAHGRLDELLKAMPQDFIVWFVAGNFYLEVREYAQAEICFTVCATLDPKFIAARMMRVESRLYQHRWQSALDECEFILRQEPRNVATWFNRGLALNGLARLEEALAAFEQARLLGFSATRIHILKSSCYTQLGDTQAARAERDLALADRPVDGLGWTARGHLRLESDPEGALSDFRQALAADPRCQSALMGEAHVLSDRLDKNVDALEAINNLLEMTSRDPLAWSGRAVLYARAGQGEQARSDIAAALRLSREPLVVLQAACVEALIPGGDADQALALLAEALIANPALAGSAAEDRDLSALRARPQFQRLIDAAETLHRTRLEPVLTSPTGVNEAR